MNTSLLDGLLLGDGHLQKNGRMKNALYAHSSSALTYSQESTLPYLEHIRDELEITYGISFTNPLPDNNYSVRGIRPTTIMLSVTNKTYQGYQIHSLANECLALQHTRWYSDKKKVLPEDLVLSPLTIKHWYIGDGSLELNRGYKDKTSYLQCIKLSTQSFSYEEQVRLVDLFCSIGFIRENLKINSRNNGRNFALYIYRKSIEHFFEYIGTSPCLCYEYKFNYRLYWNNVQRIRQSAA